VRLQLDARCVLSDSGTLTEEASILGFKSVMLREAHERPEGTDTGVTVFTAIDPESVHAAVDLVLGQDRAPGAGDVPDYAESDVSAIVARTIRGFVQYVRRTTWFGAGAVFD
jgi:UDP-N-acetylglucosamine 2-epimerase